MYFDKYMCVELMKNCLLAAILAIVTVAAEPNIQAYAETIDLDVGANRTTTIYRMVLYASRRCTAMARPELRVRKISHGKITERPGTWLVDRGECKGHRIKGTAVLYTPDRGFRGKDTVRLSFKMDRYFEDAAGYQFKTVTINLNVK